jgi:hypothetical protein
MASLRRSRPLNAALCLPGSSLRGPADACALGCFAQADCVFSASNNNRLNMQNLYWKTNEGRTVTLVNTPFENEEKLEAFVFQNQDLLENIFVFKRQVRSGSHQGIPDMLGVDQDGKVCLIEVKNITVSEDILPQVLQYAIWAETNPDSIKALWLEAKNRPEDIEINWEALELRVIVIGPDYRANVLRMSQRIGYAIELLKVTRFVADKEEFILIEQLQEQTTRKVSITKGLEQYDKGFYEREHGEEPTKELLKAVSEIEGVIKKHGWPLETKINKYYVGFKYGNVNPFNVSWGGTKAWNVHLKVTETAARGFKSSHWQFQRYDTGWKQAIFRRTNAKASAAELEPLLIEAYEHIRGKA